MRKSGKKTKKNGKKRKLAFFHISPRLSRFSDHSRQDKDSPLPTAPARKNNTKSSKMSGIAGAGAMRAVRRADAKSIFFWGKVFFCVVCPPVAVAAELHSVDTVSLWIIGASFVLWMFGFIPGQFV